MNVCRGGEKTCVFLGFTFPENAVLPLFVSDIMWFVSQKHLMVQTKTGPGWGYAYRSGNDPPYCHTNT